MDGPGVRVETVLAIDQGEADLSLVKHDLWIRRERPPADLFPGLMSTWRRRHFDEHLAREFQWTKVSISVDGVATDFDWLEEGEDWGAQTVIGDLVVRLAGHRFPVESVRLETVADVEPYLEALHRWQEELGAGE